MRGNMKQNVFATILVVVLLFLTASIFIADRIHSAKLKRQDDIESAKTSFFMRLGKKNASVDSTYVRNDTLFFYRNDSFVGKAVITTK
jgi:hypothetical protein